MISSVKKKCPVCNSYEVKDAFDLGLHPLADTFLKKEDISKEIMLFPLVIRHCKKCSHVFNKIFIPPSKRYADYDYSYETSNSKVAIEHFREFAHFIIKTLNISNDSQIIDIGGNDGTFLKFFRDFGNKSVLNIEPSQNIAKKSKKNGIKTICNFFEKKIINKISKKKKSLIISANVLNHYDQVNEFFVNCKSILASQGGYIAIEVPDLEMLIKQSAFDTIYHEHVNYFSKKVLVSLFKKHSLDIISITNTDYMGGSIRVLLSYKLKNIPILKNTFKFKSITFKDLKRLENNSYTIRFNLIRKINKILLKKEKIIAIGAATKGNTLLNFCKLDHSQIYAISDHTDLKVGKYTPLSNIKIINDKDIPIGIKYAIILPWNISKHIKNNLKNYQFKYIDFNNENKSS